MTSYDRLSADQPSTNRYKIARTGDTYRVWDSTTNAPAKGTRPYRTREAAAAKATQLNQK